VREEQPIPTAHTRGERGSALLLTVLVLVMVTSALASYLTVATATRRAVGQELARERALYAAETVAAIAVQQFAHEDLSPVTCAPPGTVSATATVTELDGTSHLVDATALTTEGQRRVQMTVRRSVTIPGVTGAVSVYAAPGETGVQASFTGEEFEVSGFDVNLTGGDGAALPKPAFSARDDATVDDVYDSLKSNQRKQVVGDGGTPSIANSEDVSNDTAAVMQSFVRSLANRAHARLPGDTTLSYWSYHEFGNRSYPRITHVQGDLTLESDGHLYGAGILIVDGDLNVSETGYLHYDGLIFVRGAGQISLRSARPWWWNYLAEYYGERFVESYYGNYASSQLRGGLVVLPTEGVATQGKISVNGRVSIRTSQEAFNLAERLYRDVRRVEVDSWWEGPQ
jgi:hypothetical protein